MDVYTFADNVSIEPEIPILSQYWGYNQTVLHISFLNNFEHATDYVLKISGDVTDLIGMQLDGNGDGIGGDDYIEFEYCLECGMMQDQFPIEQRKVLEALGIDPDEVLSDE